MHSRDACGVRDDMINTSGKQSQGHYFDHFREVFRHDHKGSAIYLEEHLSFFETDVKILLTHDYRTRRRRYVTIGGKHDYRTDFTHGILNIPIYDMLSDTPRHCNIQGLLVASDEAATGLFGVLTTMRSSQAVTTGSQRQQSISDCS